MSQMKLNEAQKKLVEENHNLIYSFLKHRNLSLNSIEDWYGTAAIGLCKAAMLYDESRGFKFSTLAYVCMEREVISVKRREYKNMQAAISLDDKVITKDGSCPLSEVIPSPNDNFMSVYVNDVIEKAFENMSTRDKSVVDMVMNHNMTQKRIADNFGMSRQSINNIYRKFIANIRESFDKDGVNFFEV